MITLEIIVCSLGCLIFLRQVPRCINFGSWKSIGVSHFESIKTFYVCACTDVDALLSRTHVDIRTRIHERHLK